MTRDQFEHAIRAAGAVLGVSQVLVIGSQALHASSEVLPAEASRSIEVDIGVLTGDPERMADLIDGSIGEASMFHDTFGYYAQGVTPGTAVLPDGWRGRLVRFESPATNGVTAWCLEPHDLWIAKAVAGREKDVEFCRATLGLRLVSPGVLRDRLSTMKLDPRVRLLVEQRIGGAPAGPL